MPPPNVPKLIPNSVQWPLISCLCVAHNSSSQLGEAINCFTAQTYPNKDMLVVYESNDEPKFRDLICKHQEIVTFIQVPSAPKMLLGELRNLAVANSRGEYVCQWDDDDWYASNRLEIQMAVLTANCKPACMLTYWIIYDAIEAQAYLSPFKFWEGSILCKRTIFTSTCCYGNLARGEDTVLLKALISGNLLVPVVAPTLYIYVFHGANTWGRAHFRRFFEAGKPLSRRFSELVKETIAGNISVTDASLLLQAEQSMSEIVYRIEMTDPYTFKYL